VLQLARLVEKEFRIFDEKRLTGSVFHHVDMAFVTVWVNGLLYEIVDLNFP
jgi:hypothetical protein